MQNNIINFTKNDLKVGNTIKIKYLKIEKNKKQFIIYEGIIIKSNNNIINVKQIIDGIATEFSILLHSPNIFFIEVLENIKIRRAKLYFLRNI